MSDTKFEQREAWAKSFIRYPVDQHHKLMMLAQDGDEAIYVSGRVFKIGTEGDCFFDQSRMFHVWHGDKWAYCGPDERYAFAVYKQAVRKAAERAN